MRITAQEEYGLRCLLQVAKLTKSNELASLEDIAGNENISTDYAAKLLSILRESNLVESVRGKNGGYRLATHPDKINLQQVIGVLSGELFEDESCDEYTGNDLMCVHTNECSIRQIWFSMSVLLSGLLNKISLSDLLEKEDILSKRLQRQIVTFEYLQRKERDQLGENIKKMKITNK